MFETPAVSGFNEVVKHNTFLLVLYGCMECLREKYSSAELFSINFIMVREVKYHNKCYFITSEFLRGSHSTGVEHWIPGQQVE